MGCSFYTALSSEGGGSLSINKFITKPPSHVQCESRGGRPGLPALMSLMVSVDVKQH